MRDFNAGWKFGIIIGILIGWIMAIEIYPLLF